MNIDGLVYLLNQAGVALAEAERQIARVTEEIGTLRAALAKKEEADK